MPRRNLIFLAVLLASSAAQADVVTVNGAAVTLLSAYGSAVYDGTKANGSVTGSTLTSPGTLGQFDAATGVLIGATATSTPDPLVALAKTGGTGTANAYSTWSLGGNSSGSTTINSMNTSQGTDFVWSPINVTSSGANLNNFVGTGNIASNSFSSYLNVNWSSGTVGAGAFSGTSISLHRDLTASESITYTYLNHANASFTSGLDTNSVTQDVSTGAFSFSAFNLGTAAATTKLDFDSYSCISGDCAAFALSPPSFEDLAAGGSGISGSVGLATANAGVYQATYKLVFSDDEDFGATNSHRENSLLLNVNGTVAAAVPEPETYAMILAGLGLMGFVARHRKQLIVA